MRKVIIVLAALIVSLNLYADERVYATDNIELSWIFIDNEIEFTYTAKTTGWLAIGFEPTQVMKNADIKIAYVDNGKLVIEDHFAHGFTSHKKDQDLGGEYNLTAIEGYEKGGKTTIIFRMPLISGDKYDASLEERGTYKVIFATGRKDNFRSIHNWRSLENITF